jgi:hypothetical protein
MEGQVYKFDDETVSWVLFELTLALKRFADGYSRISLGQLQSLVTALLSRIAVSGSF